MEKFLSQKQFDIIIATHIFPLEILANMKQQGFDIPNSVYIATDYTCIPFTEEGACDYYIIPTEEQKKEFIRWGICEEKIIPLGIPVKHQFSVFYDHKTIRKNLGLELVKRYILFFNIPLCQCSTSHTNDCEPIHCSPDTFQVTTS